MSVIVPKTSVCFRTEDRRALSMELICHSYAQSMGCERQHAIGDVIDMVSRPAERLRTMETGL